MSPPRATMRLQFHRGFTFAHAAALAPYFASLGVSHLYASPIMTARPGSMHGYDTIDATRVNPELGGEEELKHMVRQLRRHHLGLIVDIVPNHMAIGAGNAWWMDVLARGADSRYAKYFDINWAPSDPLLRGKLLLPILGRPYAEALMAGEITLRFTEGGQPAIRYFDHELPLAVECRDAVGRDSLSDFNERSPSARKRLHRILEQQHYRLSWWRCANDEINWRRFFDINELTAIRVEDEEVFDAVHNTIFRLYAEGLLDGLRIDHIDGLSQPREYCRRLRRRLADLDKKRPPDCPAGPAYVVVEKILAHDEHLPGSWETDGTTGYDFMDEVSTLQHDAAGERPLTGLWQRISGRPGDFRSEDEQARREILQRSFSSQFGAMLDVLAKIAEGGIETRDISRAALRRCLTDILVHFPVYRIYAELDDSSDCDRTFLSDALSRAAKSCVPGDKWLVELLGGWLIGKPIRPDAGALQAVVLTQFQQLSAPLSAKAVEDTAFYRYGRLISRNDVGFDPGRFACSVTEFHDRMQSRARSSPHALLATATHDHKRGEDVRARLAVLSEIPEEWNSALQRWVTLGADWADAGAAPPLPDAADRAMLFQSIIGAWPIGLGVDDEDGMKAFARRISGWQRKALREAKLRSDWSAPDQAYERLADEFVANLFRPDSGLLKEIADFVRRITAAGAVNGLSQVLAKLTAPGVPDIYQGTDYWDFSLVDPDNRAPVDFAARQRSLPSLDVGNLIIRWPDGRIKQFVIERALAVRKEMPELFAHGEYCPLASEGPSSEHALAFARILGDSLSLTVLCRHPAGILGHESAITTARDYWKNTRIMLPVQIQRPLLYDALTGNEVPASGPCLEVEKILSTLPVGLLSSRKTASHTSAS
jgi:(1->4)-alpha-D-glucan 1-alpha-D-glucosylmutase